MNDKIRNMSVMNIKQTVERANATGINISEYPCAVPSAPGSCPARSLAEPT